MKRGKLVVIGLFAVFGSLLVFISVSTESAKASGDSSGGVNGAYTGAPGELTCTDCHGPNTQTGQFHIIRPGGYVPGQTYTIQVQHVTSDTTRAAWGFELTSLTSSNAVAGTFANIGTTTFTRTRTIAGRNYIEQNAAGSFPGTTGGSTWTFSWTAPSTDLGPITFYAAGLQANNNGSTSGDQTYTDSTVVPVGATPTPTPAPTPAPTPTPAPLADISGNVAQCAGATNNPLAGATMTLTGTSGGSTTTSGTGAYSFLGLAAGGSYTVTPTKTARIPASAGINTTDVIAAQRHFLAITLLTGCRLVAADCAGSIGINTQDVIAIQRFFLGLATGTGNVGKYSFTPVSLSYSPLGSTQTGQDFSVVVFGDDATPFANPRDGGPAPDVADEDSITSTVAAVALPDVLADQSKTNFAAAVTTSAIEAKANLVGFHGDFTFDEGVVSFESEPVQNAGLTGGNWNVSGNVLPGTGPIRTLRVSAYSLDFVRLSGSGTLFELRMRRVRKVSQTTPMIWAAPPDNFIFIDTDLNTQKPAKAAPGSVSPAARQR